MSDPTLSICIVNHNAKGLTAECLRSIRAKTKMTDYEIILVDNDSSDGSQETIGRDFPGIKLIKNKKNEGFAKANNQAIEVARGRLIMLLNNDTVLKNDALDHLVTFITDHKAAGILAGKLLKGNRKMQRNCRSFYKTPFDTMFGRASLLSKLFPNNPITRRNTLSDWDYNSPRRVDWVSGAAMMIRREVIDRIGRLDENFFMYWEDTDFCKRASDAGWEVWYTPDAEIIHYTGQGGGKRSLKMRLYTMYQLHRSAYYYFRKHYYKSPLHPMAVIAYLGMIVLVVVKGIAEVIRSMIGPIK